MARILELVRRSALPSHQMMAAAKGALDVSAEEMVEILVFLAENNKIFGETSRITLAGWDENSARSIAANPATAKEVLDYWLSPKNLRPALFPLLLENSAVTLEKISQIGSTLKGEWIDAMLASPRIQKSQQVLREIATNNQLSGVQSIRVQELITGKPAAAAAATIAAPAPEALSSTQPPTPLEPASAPEGIAEFEVVPDPGMAEPDPETEKVVIAFMAQHASEIAAEPNKPFQAIGGIQEEAVATETHAVAAAASVAATPAKPVTTVKMPPKKLVNPEEQRGSVLQKISALDVKGRIQLAMKGTKEERSILVRDGTKVVALAVLDSPKITDGEVEKFANQKNVLEALLRAIPMKRRFAKNYVVVRNLVANPRTPLDVSLGLMKNLLVQDLKNLSGNKEVSDTVRKLALRMFKQKLDPGKG